MTSRNEEDIAGRKGHRGTGRGRHRGTRTASRERKGQRRTWILQ